MTRAAAASVFDAIADPTRRGVLHVLRDGERPVAELQHALGVSQSALSQHLRVLREAKLVANRKDGRRRLYSLEAGPLREVFDWVTYFESFWDDRLAALGRHLKERA